VLLLDYMTSGFSSKMNAVNGSYEARIPMLEDTRWRVGGNWSTYSADEFGGTAKFSGEQWEMNAALQQSLIAEPGFFVDGYLGTRWMQVSVVNIDKAFGGNDMPFFVPSLGVLLDRTWSTARLQGHMGFEQSVPSIAGTSLQDMEDFSNASRANLTQNWRTLSGQVAGSVFLEPWFHGTRFYDPRPLHAYEMTHEVAWRFGGQTSLGTRLIPQVEGVLGGVGTVRGYPQSIVSGDSFVNGSVEYRYHVPLGFATLEPIQIPWFGAFRVGPDTGMRLPDWDLVLALFSDYGQVFNQSKVLGESDDRLASIGVGFEVIVRRNFSLRLDYGIALLSVDTANVNSGDGEFNFSALVRY
jgi:hemolysin activation/secretion protein